MSLGGKAELGLDSAAVCLRPALFGSTTIRHHEGRMRDTLTRPQRRAAQLRGRGWSLTEIAKELGVSTRTLVRWNRLPAFRGEQARTRDAEQPLSLRQTLEAGLLATKALPHPVSRGIRTVSVIGTKTRYQFPVEQPGQTTKSGREQGTW